MDSVAPRGIGLDPAAPNYRFDHPRLSDIVHDMFIRSGELGPGDQVPAFDLPTTDGRRFNGAELSSTGRPVLVVFGSRTCPVTESGADGLRALHEQYGDRVRFVMVQVREAHPGATIAQPQSLEEKSRHALAMKRRYILPFDVAIDDVDGTFHRALGARPNSAFVVDAGGTILFRAQWANETGAIAEALDAISRGQAPPRSSVTRTLPAIAKTAGFMSVALANAGRGARLDTWKVAPPMAVLMHAADLFFFLPRQRRGLPAMVLLMSAAAAVGVAAWALL